MDLQGSIIIEGGFGRNIFKRLQAPTFGLEGHCKCPPVILWDGVLDKEMYESDPQNHLHLGAWPTQEKSSDI